MIDRIQVEIRNLNRQMEAIYNPDSMYEMSFYDLDFDDQEAYSDLRMKRNALIAKMNE